MATQILSRSVDKTNLLRRALQFDGVTAALFGIDLVIWANPIGAFLGLDGLAVEIAGAVAAVYGGLLLWRSSQRELDLRLGMAAIALNTVWVVASLLMIVTNTPALTVEGKWAVGIVAALVDVIATVQFIGLRRARRSL